MGSFKVGLDHHRHILKTGSRQPRDASDEDVSKIFAVISDKRDEAMFGPMVGASLHVSGVSPLQLDDIEEHISPGSLAWPNEEHISPGSLAKLRIHGKGDLVRTFDLTT